MVNISSAQPRLDHLVKAMCKGLQWSLSVFLQTTSALMFQKPLPAATKSPLPVDYMALGDLWTQEKSSEVNYNDIAPMTSDAYSDDDPVVGHGRNSTQIAHYDREILEEESEQERLLARSARRQSTRGFFGKRNGSPQSGKKMSEKGDLKPRKRRKERPLHYDDEEGELMYEMEEGGPTSETSSLVSSSSTELDRLNVQGGETLRGRTVTQTAIVSASIIVLFVVLTFGAYRVTHTSSIPPHATLLSNGTSKFAPTTILISLDGFRADFLTRGITPTLNQFIAEGVSPRYMLPSFPSLTFPNHFTLVTGLYPESHGIVGNTFWDPEMEAGFFYTDPARSMQPKWWADGEPIWVTAEKQNVKTAIHMWPGSEAGMEYSAAYLDKYNGSEVLPRKTARILELLDLPSIEDSAMHQRPQLIAAYVPVVDADGHKYGPNSTQIWDTISNVDKMLHNIFIGLDERNLTDIVNVIVVSDHGMATTSTDRLIQLDDLIDLNLVEHIDGWPLYGLRPKDPLDLSGLYDKLNAEAMQNPNFDVYLRDENMPDRFHFSQHRRIAPLWVVPKAGWAIVHKKDFNVKEAKAKGETYNPKGLHGYDHEHPLMRAIFVARGPAFPHRPNSKLNVLQNTEVYNILCDSLGIEPKPNNGTLRLPLRPVGLHSDGSNESNDAEDFLPNTEVSAHLEGDVSGENPPAENNIASNKDQSTEGYNKFWAYMKDKMHEANEWAHKAMEKVKGWNEDAQRQSNP
ncbi:MAG: hypothetical protein Q9163_001441 [Psora crenata]